MDKSRMKIKILKNGPYMVYGGIPLSEKIIVPKGNGYIWKEGRPLPQAEKYALCRCGKSKSAPFCDGAHIESGFTGTETASREPYEKRCEVLKGPDLDLLDDNRCAFARFCHRERGNVWDLVRASDNPRLKAEAIKAALDCPTGRLRAREKDGFIHEPVYEPAIEIIKDEERNVCGGIIVKGYIPIESADGYIYEPRSTVVLCRCGYSRDLPFCDGFHASIGFITSP